jgi:hypothetical protein
MMCILQIVARRSALGLMAGAAALLTKTGASQAAFGDAARVFGGKWASSLLHRSFAMLSDRTYVAHLLKNHAGRFYWAVIIISH